jgi:hypothetical protein
MPSSDYEEGIECTPDSLFRGVAGCFGFLVSLLVVASLGMVAGGVFWTAQNMERITTKASPDEMKFVYLKKM